MVKKSLWPRFGGAFFLSCRSWKLWSASGFYAPCKKTLPVATFALHVLLNLSDLGVLVITSEKDMWGYVGRPVALFADHHNNIGGVKVDDPEVEL